MTIRAYTSDRLYNALKQLISNLPQHAVSIEIEMRPQSIPVMRATVEVLETTDPPVPKIENGKVVTRDAMFEIVPVGTVEALEMAALALAGADASRQPAYKAVATVLDAA